MYYLHDIRDPVEKCYLHGFSDASNSAYAAVVYIKAVTKYGNISVTFVTSKLRIVPMNKSITIPRLELLGNFILSNLIRSVYNSLSEEIFIEELICWTDSFISLSWIKAVNQEFKLFVQNRVIKIRESVKPSLWNYCNTKENPADKITRFRLHDLSSNSLWWEGPFFLKDINEETLCTKENLEIETQKNDAEFITEFGREIINKSTTLVSILKEVFGLGNIINIEYFSNLITLFHLSVGVLRFVTNLKKKRSSRKLNFLNRFISTSEIRFVKLLWIQDNQAKLENSDNFNNLKYSLHLQKNSNDIYRSSSRISNAKSLSYDAKNPIILCRNHRLTEMIVWDAHNRIKHLGERQTLAEIRSCYWIPRGKSFVKKVLHRCITCKRFNSRSYSYPNRKLDWMMITLLAG